MTQTVQLPDPEKVKRTVARLRETGQQLDALTMALDELIAKVEADIRNSPINVRRREKAKHLGESVKHE
ncbi:hypothetical protein QUB63_32710 [Microcoleus sp. ARI1-B5]|uniref:hypothetical protein n=1 Tax=unclassified Microcoleus TaxID=2642155 RepID=UPI002FCE9EDE